MTSKERRHPIVFGVLLLLLFAGNAFAAPKVGMHYYTWFHDFSDYPSSTSQSNDCYAPAWATGSYGPFEAPVNQVQSLITGNCYRSMNPLVAYYHALYLDPLGVDFVIFDLTNDSKRYPWDQDRQAKSSEAALSGLALNTARTIQAVYQLSLTCYDRDCWPGGSYGPQPREVFAGRDLDASGYTNGSYNPIITNHIEKIASLYLANPSRFVVHQGKPLLLFYVSQGSNVMSSPTAVPSPYFNGAGNLYPTVQQYNPPFTVNSLSTTLHDFFTVRFTIVAANYFDYSPYSSTIWPFQCHNDCNTTEAGYASLYSTVWDGRSPTDFGNDAYAARDKQFLLVRSWNEFAKFGDEKGKRSYTIEPNTYLHTVDNSPNQDPWFMYNSLRPHLNNYKEYKLVAIHSGKCVDVEGGSGATSAGLRLQQWDCNGGANQTFYVRAFGPEIPLQTRRYVVPKISSQCVGVENSSTSNGAVVRQNPCGITANQRFWLEPFGANYPNTYQLRFEHSNSCMDVTGGPTAVANGVGLQQWNCLSGQTNQAFRLERIS